MGLWAGQDFRDLMLHLEQQSVSILSPWSSMQPKRLRKVEKDPLPKQKVRVLTCQMKTLTMSLSWKVKKVIKKLSKKPKKTLLKNQKNHQLAKNNNQKNRQKVAGNLAKKPKPLNSPRKKPLKQPKQLRQKLKKQQHLEARVRILCQAVLLAVLGVQIVAKKLPEKPLLVGKAILLVNY